MAPIKEGEKAPAFTLQNAFEDEVSLSEFNGKWLILYFYPKDNTPGCTLEAMDFSQNKKYFEQLNAHVVGVSKDSCRSHQNFIDKKGLTITLLSDPDSLAAKTYGVYAPKKFMGREFLGTIRSTFIIGPKGVIRKVYVPVKAKGHAEKVLQDLQMLQKERKTEN